MYEFDFEGCVIETAQKVTKEKTSMEPIKNSITTALTGRTVYKVTVKTANEARAGTDDRVFVQIHGDSGMTHREELKGTWIRNEFEKNQVDTFQGYYFENHIVKGLSVDDTAPRRISGARSSTHKP